jgi:hypothetical protein
VQKIEKKDRHFLLTFFGTFSGAGAWCGDEETADAGAA